jgi:hypothetical protein
MQGLLLGFLTPKGAHSSALGKTVRSRILALKGRHSGTRFRPFRAQDRLDFGSQGVALG